MALEIGYRTIPLRTASRNAAAAASLVNHSENQTRLRSGFPFFGGRLLSVLGIAAAFAAVIFVVNNHQNYAPQLSRFSYHDFGLIPSIPSPWRVSSSQLGSPYSPPFLQRKYFKWKTYFSRPSLNNIIRSDLCHADSDIEKTVPTNDCTVRLACNARVVVKKTETGITAQAGYYIYPTTGKARDVTPETQERVQAATPRQATKWANALLEELESELAEVDCIVSAQMIADAIMETKDDAASCPNTDDSLCRELVTLKECPCETGVKFGNVCYNFLASGAEITSFDDLKEGCAEAEFLYNKVYVPLPLCSFTCPSEPSVTHTYDINFYVQGRAGEENKDGYAVAIPPSYEQLYLPVPSCDEVPPSEHIYSTLYVYYLYNRHTQTAPEFLAALSAETGVRYDYVAFMTFGVTVSEYINSVC